MVSPDKLKMLSGFLASLPESVASRLARAVEVDQLGGGNALPHDEIMAALRPTLRRKPLPKRTLNPQRLFCRPFEDLLANVPPRKEKQKGRIARATVQPLWSWLAQTLTPQALNTYSLGVRTALLAFRPQDAVLRASEFWPVASKAIQQALDSESKRKAAKTIFGDAPSVADVQEIALLLTATDELLKLQETLPRPVPALNDDLLWTLREFYDRLVAATPDVAPYVAVVTMNRLAKPWMALKLPMLITRQTQDTLISSTDMGLVGELLFGDLEEHATALRSARPQAPFVPEDIIRHLSGFTAVSDGLVKEMEIRRDGKWGQRLMKDRSAVAEVMEGFMERAEREVTAAIPMGR